MGRTSIAQLRLKLQKKHGKEPDRLMLYDVGHRRKDGTYVDENAKKKMELANALQSERFDGSSSQNLSEINEAIFKEVMGEEHNGRVRGVGLGPTLRSYFSSQDQDSISQDKHVKNIEEQLSEMQNKCLGLSIELSTIKSFLASRFPDDQWQNNEFAEAFVGGNGAGVSG